MTNLARNLTTLLVAGTTLLACSGGANDSSAAAVSEAAQALDAGASTFGLTTSADFYVVDTGGGLVFKVRRVDDTTSTRSPGDIASLVFKGVEYQDQERGSQINSGFNWLYSGVSAVTVDAAVVGKDSIKITVHAGDLVHYYLARRGQPYIAMATYFTSEPSTLGMCRYILRLPSTLLPNGPAPSDIRNTVRTVEAKDIFALPNGETRSKHYSNQRLIDWKYTGATGTDVGVWMVRDNGEGGSGGPFYRSLINQCGSDQEIYNIANYGEAQTEGFRTGTLNGPYTLVFTNGGAPPPLDLSWVGDMGLEGYLGPEGRGRVTGVGISGRDQTHAYTVAFSSPTAQYWTTASADNGHFDMTGMRPGTYAMTIYKGELAVDTRSVSVTAGGITALHTISITGDPSQVKPLWRIGDWDGTPTEFLNGDKITKMHPSDVRMANWKVPTFVVGASSAGAGFPCYQWADVNSPITIQFELAADQIAPHTVRVGITTAYSGGRPRIAVNGWTSPIPSASTQPNSRTMTVGTYRGNNTLYTFEVPASAFVAGTNRVTISTVSGSSGTGFLSPGFSFDSVDMY